MEWMFDPMNFNPGWLALLGICLVGVEVLFPKEIFLWAGLSCIVVALVNVWAPWTPRVADLTAWVVLAVGGYISSRRYHAKAPVLPVLSSTEVPWMGRRVVLLADTQAGLGQVRLDQTLWAVRCMGAEMKVGQEAFIIGREGSILLVKSGVGVP